MDLEEDPADEGAVLSPQELDLLDKEGVAQIDDDRFVVSPDGTAPNLPPGHGREERPATDRPEAGTTAEPAPAAEPSQPSGALDRTSIRDWHEDHLDRSPSRYGYHVSLKAEGAIDHHALESDDVTMAFNNLLLWYARTIDSDLPPGAVLGILLADASVPIQYPVRALEEFVMAQGLSTDDSIGDLLEAVRSDQRMVFPPRTE